MDSPEQEIESGLWLKIVMLHTDVILQIFAGVNNALVGRCYGGLSGDCALDSLDGRRSFSVCKAASQSSGEAISIQSKHRPRDRVLP